MRDIADIIATNKARAIEMGQKWPPEGTELADHLMNLIAEHRGDAYTARLKPKGAN